MKIEEAKVVLECIEAMSAAAVDMRDAIDCVARVNEAMNKILLAVNKLAALIKAGAETDPIKESMAPASDTNPEKENPDD